MRDTHNNNCCQMSFSFSEYTKIDVGCTPYLYSWFQRAALWQNEDGGGERRTRGRVPPGSEEEKEMGQGREGRIRGVSGAAGDNALVFGEMTFLATQ